MCRIETGFPRRLAAVPRRPGPLPDPFLPARWRVMIRRGRINFITGGAAMTLRDLTPGQRFQFLDGTAATYTFGGTAFPRGFAFYDRPDDVQISRTNLPVRPVS